MSRSFSYIISNVLRGFGQEVILGSTLIGVAGNLCYALGTKNEKQIIIKEKYKFVRNGFTEFMIIDSEGKHYNINNSFWYMKWDSIEDWTLLQKNNSTYIKYYGWRVPFLGLFPNVISTNKLNKNYNFNTNKKFDFDISENTSEDISNGKFS